MTQRQWVLARRPPDALPSAGDFRMVTVPIPEPGPRQMLTRTLYLSLDPYQWGRRRGGAEKVGDVCHGRTVSQVVRSNIAGYAAGDIVFNTNGWAEYGLTDDGTDPTKHFGYMFPRKLDPGLAPVSTAVGVLGMLGLTAYAGMYLQCRPQRGETAVVSAASGGVGQVAAQIARVCGCRVVGIAGPPEKCAWVKDTLRLDACVSYRSATFAADLRAACPDGVDAYFENVGGAVFDAVLPLLRRGARLSLCGMMSGVNPGGNVAPAAGDPRKEWFAKAERKRAELGIEVQQVAVGKFVPQHEAAFLRDMSAWVRRGEMHYREHVVPGLDRAPETMLALLTGRTFGKTLIAVAADPTLDDATRRRRARGEDVLAPRL